MIDSDLILRRMQVPERRVLSDEDRDLFARHIQMVSQLGASIDDTTPADVREWYEAEAAEARRMQEIIETGYTTPSDDAAAAIAHAYNAYLDEAGDALAAALTRING